MPDDRGRASVFKALTLFAVNAVVYLAAFFGIVFIPTWPAKLVLGALTAIPLSTLFIVGHDGCHGSLTPRCWLNSFLGHLGFLPSLHPYSAWELGHNRLHHGWTNLRGRDYGYPPFTKAEYDALPRSRRFLERIYRTVWGVGLHYLIEIWWKHMMFPHEDDWKKLNRGVFQRDRALVIGFAILQIASLLLTARWAAAHGWPSLSPLGLIAVGWAWPFLWWNWTMAFVTYQHHTHPQVAWYDNKEDWCFYYGQIEGTVHVTFSRPIEMIFHNILEHTAHHVDPKIPLYNLRASQESLETAFSESITVQKGSLLQFAKVLKVCRLYDYRNHQWLDFDGIPTSEPIHK